MYHEPQRALLFIAILLQASRPRLDYFSEPRHENTVTMRGYDDTPVLKGRSRMFAHQIIIFATAMASPLPLDKVALVQIGDRCGDPRW